jgi:hypothetical protein
MEEVWERARRIREANQVRKMSNTRAPLYIPTRLVQQRENEIAGKKPKNEIDIDALAADAQKKAREEQEKLNEKKETAPEDKQKLAQYALDKIKDLKKPDLVKICIAGEVKVNKDKKKDILIDAIMAVCEKKGTEWLLKMI